MTITSTTPGPGVSRPVVAPDGHGFGVGVSRARDALECLVDLETWSLSDADLRDLVDQVWRLRASTDELLAGWSRRSTSGIWQVTTGPHRRRRG